jgi:hypothetical protein
MSAIHKALSQKNASQAVDVSSSYNPLAAKSKTRSKLPWQTVFIILFLMATIAVILWPTRSTQSDELVPPVKEEQTELPAQSASLEMEEPETPVESTAPPAIVESTAEQSDLGLPIELSDVPESENSTVSDNTTETISIAEQAAPSISSPNTAPEIAPKPAIETPPVTSQSTTAGLVPVIDAELGEEVQQSSTVSIASSNDTIESEADATSTVNPSAGELNTQDTIGVIRKSQNNWQAQVENHIANGEIEQAEALLKTWIATVPSDSTARIWLAKIYMNNGFLRAAEPLLKPVKDAEAKALLGIIYERTNRPLAAATLFEELFRSDPTEGKWLLFWAVNTENTGELAKSRTLYQNYLTLFAQDDANLTQFAERRLRVLQGQ